MSDFTTAGTHVDALNNLLVFDTEGYYMVGDAEWQDLTFTTTLIYNGGNIGIAPRVYDTNMYLFLNIQNQEGEEAGTTQGFASLNAQITYDTDSIAQSIIEPLVVGESYTFQTDIRGTNYRISLNGTVLFNIEYPGMSKGRVGIYATAGNSCSSIEIENALPDGWTTNGAAVPGGIVSLRELGNEDKYLHLVSPDASGVPVEAAQDLQVQGGRGHSLSFDYRGEGTARLRERDGQAPTDIEHLLPLQADWTRVVFSEAVSADCTVVEATFSVQGQELDINDVQVEPKAFATGYILNDSIVSSRIREHSLVSYPAKDNIVKDHGSLVMWFSPNIDYTAANTGGADGPSPVLFEYGSATPIRLCYQVGGLSFNYGNQGISVPVDLLAGEWYSVAATWDAQQFQLHFQGETTTYRDVLALPDDSDVIRIGFSEDVSFDRFNGKIDETVVLGSVLNEDEMAAAETAVEPLAANTSMLMRATFNYAIGNFNQAIVEGTMSPDYGSPVLVEKRSGASLRKVSFFDFYSGEYRTFNEEVVMYEEPNDYVEISYHDNEVDEESFRIKVEDDEGVQYGMPYEMDGRNVHLSLTEAEKTTLDGKYLHVSYQLEDSYTVDFNIGVPDSFRVSLGKHDGEPVKITYEGNRFSDEKLATMVELNPLLNPNHEGFLYITRNDEPVTAFRGMATPNDLTANGSDQALVVVEPLDANGNYVSHCSLTVTTENGIITPAYDSESIKMRDRAGRFLYRYQAPILTIDQVSGFEVTDYVNVLDQETGIGIKIPINLTALKQQTHILQQGDTLFSLSAEYGTTRRDIASVNDMGLDQAAAYVLKNSGEPLRIPINYAVQKRERVALTAEQDSMVAYLTNEVVHYFNRPVTDVPAGLGALLDFNNDALIGMGEIEWLQQKRLTSTLTQKYNEVVAWHQANQ